MRILVTSYPERTHFLMLVPFAWALRAAGHEVLVAVQPGFEDEVRQAGLPFVTIGAKRHLWQALGRFGNFLMVERGLPPPYDCISRTVDELSLADMVEGYRFNVHRWHKMSNVPMVPELVDLAQDWRPDVVLWEPATYAGAIAARACGAMSVRMIFGADAYGLARHHYLRMSGAADGPVEDPLREWLGGYSERHGFEWDESLVVGDLTLDVLAEPLQMHVPTGGPFEVDYLPMRYVPFGGRATLPRWMWQTPSRPRLGFTLGLTADDHDLTQSYEAGDVLRRIADEGVEVVATTKNWRTDWKLASLATTDGVRIVEYVPLQALAATSSVVVNHAGVGTLNTCALAGTPQVCLPFDSDAPVVAARYADTGAGFCIQAEEATEDGIVEAIMATVDDPRYRASAEELAEQMHTTPSPSQVAALLPDLVSARRSIGIAS